MGRRTRNFKRAGRRRTREWHEWYADARAYSEQRGDLLVPRDYVTAEGFRLGRWIGRQRALYNEVPSAQGCLSRLQVTLLEQIGMVWRLEYRFPWTAWMEQARRYLEDHGDLLVPPDYEIGSFRLGNWIAEQRKRYAAGEMPEPQIADLDACGMVWSFGIVRREWMDWYADAKRYYACHGDLLVKCDYRTEQGAALGSWIFEQRVIRAGKKPGRKLTEEQVRLLDEIRMVWNLDEVRDGAWERMYIWVSAYRAEHGALPLWPRGIAAPDGRKMDAWIRTQRMDLAAGRVPPGRAARLAGLGITAQRKNGQYDEFHRRGVHDIGEIRGEQWERMLGWVADYRRKYGRLPVRGLDEIAPDGRNMEGWVAKQRQSLADGRLSEEQRRRLLSIGIQGAWEAQEQDWMTMYRLVAAYREAHGALPSQKCPERAPDGRKLGMWVSSQRRKLAAGKATEAQREMLEALGVRPEGRRARPESGDGAADARESKRGTEGVVKQNGTI